MTTWVLLRGLAREAGHWGRFMQMLRVSVPPGDEVVAIDLPGNGELHRERSPCSVAQMVRAARRQLATLGVQPPYRLLALSLGGMVALEWAALHPRELAGVALVNGSFGGLSPVWQRLRPGSWGPLLALLRPGLDACAREQRVLQLTSNREIDPAVLEQWTNLAERHPVSRINLLRQLLAAARCRLPAVQPRVPVVLYASRTDRLVCAECSRALARTWWLPISLHPDAGHDLPLDAPEWLVERLLGTVSRGAAPASPTTAFP